MTNKLMNLARALQLRDTAMKVLRQLGAWEPTNSNTTNVRRVQTDKLHIVLRTPVLRLPEVSKTEHMNHLAVLNDVMRTHQLPYGLDIWFAQEKVLNLSWDDTGNCDLINFQPGLWEAELTELTIDHESWAG